MKKSGRLARCMAIVAGLCAVAWSCGLVLFVGAVAALPEPAISPALETTDAIVVLTGGSDRLTTGIDLLKAGKGKKLFISGVYRGLTLDRLSSGQAIPPRLRGCCVILGHAAESTQGNAAETREWMKSENYHSLRLVTANYHMPRSLMIFRAALPDDIIVPHPVAPDSVRLADWWNRPGTASLLVTEYDKYLWALIRLKLERL